MRVVLPWYVLRLLLCSINTYQESAVKSPIVIVILVQVVILVKIVTIIL